MRNDNNDRLVHILLREMVGGETPPDVTEKVLALASAERGRTSVEMAPPDVTEKVLSRAFGRPRRRRWYIAGAAAAAVAAVLVALLTFGRYPSPEISGDYKIVGGERLERGSAVVTEDRSAVITLGGYCRIELQLESALQIKGGKKAEQVLLRRGGVECEVDQRVGAFAVETEIGTVSVVGTKFAVRLIEEKGDAAALGARLLVRVLEGEVSVSGDWGTALLRAGEEKLLPDGGMVTGMLLETSPTAVTIKAAGEKEAKRYEFGREMAAATGQVFPGFEYRVVWREDRGRRQALTMEMVVPDELRDFTNMEREAALKLLFDLGQKRDPRAREGARKLLDNDDKELWIAATEYLALIGDEDVLPYMMKAMDDHEHPRWCFRLAAAFLSLTGRDFGSDAWLEEWRKRHPDMDMESIYRKVEEGARALSGKWYRIHTVADPTTMLHHDIRIRLIGIRPKKDADTESAVTALKTLAVNQWVRLEFDDGPELTADRARRAFAFWGGGADPEDDAARAGLEPVLLKKFTHINEHLLTTGLYEIVPGADFAIAHSELEKVALKFDSRTSYVVDDVADATTIVSDNVGIKLIGIRLKQNADEEQAVRLLKTLLLNQWIALEFPDGAQLTEDRERRACVFWTMPNDPEEGAPARKDLPPVPFKTWTNVNEYLLDSELYEADPAVDLAFVDRKKRELTLGLGGLGYYFVIFHVEDPTTILFHGARFRLIGVRLKQDADREEAMTLLRTLVVNQRVMFGFDDGPKLTEDGARRAVVVWREGHEPRFDKMVRRGLPEVPFKTRTAINEHLLKSELYEADPDVDAGVFERALGITLTNWDMAPVQEVIDPTTIRFLNTRIRLVGVKLKQNADPQQAVALLKTLLMNQYIWVRFEEGPEFADDDARQAFVFWIMPGDPKDDAELRRGLGQAPFTTRTNVNEYLLESGLYDIDPDVDFISVDLQIAEETADLNDELYYIVHHVADPTTVLCHGRPIKLIGVRLKDEADPKEAVVLLKTLLINQGILLTFDDGPALTMDGDRRAFVYWYGQGHTTPPGIDECFRRGLPEVPFKEKTLVNAHLIKSGLYEIDPATVQSEQMVEELKAGAEVDDP